MHESASARVLLKRHRESLNLSQRAAAKQLAMSHVMLRDIERGTKLPSELYKNAIQRWSGGRIVASSWPLPAKQRDRIDRILSVGLAQPAPTGTDST